MSSCFGPLSCGQDICYVFEAESLLVKSMSAVLPAFLLKSPSLCQEQQWCKEQLGMFRALPTGFHADLEEHVLVKKAALSLGLSSALDF